jgi:hypothetical protein
MLNYLFICVLCTLFFYLRLHCYPRYHVARFDVLLLSRYLHLSLYCSCICFVECAVGVNVDRGALLSSGVMCSAAICRVL